MTRKYILLTLYLLILLLGLASPVMAETNASYDLSWWTVDSGGVSNLTAGAYTLSGTAGQPEPGSLSAGDYSLTGGFWTMLLAELRSFLPLIAK
jgi:hypothetical protein